MSSAVLPPGFENPITPTTKITIDSVLFNNLKSIGQNIWQSPGGIIYGPDIYKKQGIVVAAGGLC